MPEVSITCKLLLLTARHRPEECAHLGFKLIVKSQLKHFAIKVLHNI